MSRDESLTVPPCTDREAFDGARLDDSNSTVEMTASTFTRGATEFHNAFDY